MLFNFDEPIERYRSDSNKWHKYAGTDIIPLWIADTDFRSPPAIIEALHQRVQHGIFGYGYPPPELTELLIQRMYYKYQWKIKAEWLIFLPGLVCGINISLRALTSQTQSSITPYPIYPPFVKAASYADRAQVFAPMKLKEQRWIADFNCIESLMTGKEKLLFLCNPHNPGGTVYRREELMDQLSFAQKHDLYVCSDEIHCDLLLKENVEHIPFATLNDDAAWRSITLMAPSKTFNIAGLGTSFAIIPNPQLRASFMNIQKGIVPEVNLFGYTAALAAYRDGESWLEAQLAYLRTNHQRVLQRINLIPGLKMMPSEATYLAWIDATALNVSKVHKFFEEAGVGLSPGRDYGNDKFVRLNFGCRRDLLEQALGRMEKAVAAL